MIKPDGVQRSIVGELISRFERRGYKLVGMKMTRPSKAHFETHYCDLKGLSFFPTLLKYMMMGPVVAMVWEGVDVVKQGRRMLGETKPLESQPGTIRGDYCINVGRNIMHGSDSVESANKEIALWFKPEELCPYDATNEPLIYE